MSKITEPIVHYEVAVDPQRHELTVEVRMADPFAAGDSLSFAIPTWVPGNYNFMQFARDIFSFAAVDNETGRELKVTREGWQGFRVHEPSGDIQIRYRAYAFEPELGEPSGILDSSYAVLLGTRYLYSPQHFGICRVSYQLPEEWAGQIHHPSGAEKIGEATWEYPSFEILGGSALRCNEKLFTTWVSCSPTRARPSITSSTTALQAKADSLLRTSSPTSTAFRSPGHA